MLSITVGVILAGLLIGMSWFANKNVGESQDSSMLWFESKDMGESQDNQLKPEEIVDAVLLLARMWMDLTSYSKLDTKNYEIHLQNNIRSLRKLIIQIYEAHGISIELPINDERETEDDKKQPQDQVITADNQLSSSLQDLSQLIPLIYLQMSIKQPNDYSNLLTITKRNEYDEESNYRFA